MSNNLKQSVRWRKKEKPKIKCKMAQERKTTNRCSRARWWSFVPVVVLLLLRRECVCTGEYVFPEVNWTSDACLEQGFTKDQFELCATLEFCEGSGDFGFVGNVTTTTATNHHHEHPDRERTLLRQRKLPEQYYTEDYTSATIIKQVVPSEGRFGWRIPGTEGCISPGPLLRLSRGTKYGLFISNNAASHHATNIHLHGLHIAGSGNGDDVTRHVDPGDVVLYNLTIPSHHMGGTFLYHSHLHDHIQEQVSGGAFGMLIMEDGNDIGTENPQIRQFLNNDHIMIIDNLRNHTHYTVNGMQNATYHLNENEWYRFRLLHVNVDAQQTGVHVTFGAGCQVHTIAHDGIFKFTVPGPLHSEFFFSPSTRLDLAVKCKETTEIKANNHTIVNIDINSIEIDPKPDATPFENGESQWQSTRPPYLQDLSKLLTVDRTWNVDVHQKSLNNQTCDMDHPLCNDDDQDFEYGIIYEWTLQIAKNTSGRHPFHLHVYPMQIVADCGSEHEVGEFYDTILVQNSSPDCKVRIFFVDVAGPIMMHCHILQHEEMGAMGFINVLGGPQQPLEPRVICCASGGTCDAPKALRTCQEDMRPMGAHHKGD
jgi:FtsP/CotA-like multicopper oxidase with cupredoxin domain